ncbi:MAG: response regulator [Bacteroidota bacterium]
MFEGVIAKPTTRAALLSRINHVLAADPTFSHSPLPKQSPVGVRDFSNFSILLVEDNQVNQKVAQKILRKFEIQAEVAQNGQEAVEFVHIRTFDLIFMDMQMPVMDGVEAAKQIRALGNRIQQPLIIAMTANTSVEDQEMCLAAGMNDFLCKPITMQTIQQYLTKWLKQAQEAVAEE